MTFREPDFFLRQGDHGETIPGVLEDTDCQPVDIAGASVRFLMANILTATRLAANATNEQSGDGSDGSLGKVSYTWQDGDSDEPGLYNASWEVTFNDGTIQTFPNPGYIKVRITPKVFAPVP